MKKILFATDFSSNANKAFSFALNMAEKHKADLIMVHVFNLKAVWTYPYTGDPIEMKAQAAKSWERSLKEFFEHYDSKVKASYFAVENHTVVQGILSVIEKQKPQLVVTGTRGKSTVKELLLGSTTKALVKKSPVPVLAVPNYAELKDYDKVLYTSDFREVDLKALQDLVDLVGPFEPEIKVLHMSTDNEFEHLEKLEWLKELINDNVTYPAISCDLILCDDTFTSLNRYMSENDFDLLVMLEKERGGIVDKMFHQSLVNKMEFRTWIPLLSYNEHYLSQTGREDVKKGSVKQ
ncbi:universal stress protein [Lutimonas vermicola]|uniref:Universal stress protein n=1 Tax=Lutimonas vermicola TaxID=414288 RepID=A0ABU9KZR9_9FLAO